MGVLLMRAVLFWPHVRALDSGKLPSTYRFLRVAFFEQSLHLPQDGKQILPCRGHMLSFGG